MSYLAITPDVTSSDAEACFILACATAAVNVAGFGSSVQDVCGSSKYMSAVYSVSSAPAVICGSLGVYGTGVLLEATHDWTLVFGTIASAYCFGAFVYCRDYIARKVID